MKQFKDLILGIDYILPLEHGHLTIWDTFRSATRPHHMGVDLCGNPGDKALCCFSGKVRSKGNSAFPGGFTIDIENADESTVASYSHLVNLKVKIGDIVTMGQVLGELMDVRPHIHFQLRAWIDPETTLRIPKSW